MIIIVKRPLVHEYMKHYRSCKRYTIMKVLHLEWSMINYGGEGEGGGGGGASGWDGLGWGEVN